MCKPILININCADDLKGGSWAEVKTFSNVDNGNKAEFMFENLPSWYQIDACNAYYLKNKDNTYSKYNNGV